MKTVRHVHYRGVVKPGLCETLGLDAAADLAGAAMNEFSEREPAEKAVAIGAAGAVAGASVLVLLACCFPVAAGGLLGLGLLADIVNPAKKRNKS